MPNFYELREASWVMRPKKEDQWDELRDIYRDIVSCIDTLDDEMAKLYLKNRMRDMANTFGAIKKLTQWQFSDENA